jgi:hypothetical protein
MHPPNNQPNNDGKGDHHWSLPAALAAVIFAYFEWLYRHTSTIGTAFSTGNDQQ